jgi:hypothetical protein
MEGRMDWRDPAIAAGIAAALGSVFGGLITGAFTVWPLKQEIKRNGYIHLDATYNTIIDRSAKYPEFSDAKLVSVYADAFKDKLQEYEAYAWLVHNFLETIFDLSYNRRKNKIDDDWNYLFDHFAELHLQWALNGKRPLRDEYLRYIETKYRKELKN